MKQKVIFQFFSNQTNLLYQLIDDTYPILSVSGIRMHVGSPKDTYLLKQKLFHKLFPKNPHRALDLCTGLGYSSIMLSRFFDEVVTVEKDSNIVLLWEINPLSSKLLNSRRIRPILADAFSYVSSQLHNSFDFIHHDPPRYSLSPELYSLEFYHHLYRILKPRRFLYHYTGLPSSRFRVKRHLKGIAHRLFQAGFRKIKWIDPLQGFIALRP